MRSLLILLVVAPVALSAQAPGRFPPDSLVNTHVIPRTTPVIQVIGQMRNFAGELGVRCQFCHIGEEGMPLERFDFASDDKRTKQVARQMLRMVNEINARLDTIPGRPTPNVRVTCGTCHRGVSRPMPLPDVLVAAATAGGADSAIRAYRSLRERYHGAASYDFSEPTLAFAAFRLGRQLNRIDDGLALLRLNEEFWPNSSQTAVFRGNLLLMRADTNGAADAFREALRRDGTNSDARGRLRQIGRPAP